MKLSRADVRGKATLGMELRFETQDLTSYSGLILFQHFFSLIGIKERLWRCFRHLKANPIYGHHVMVMLLVVHLIIGHRRLRDLDYYRDDELVKRVLGLKRLPDVSTLSRLLSSADEHSVSKVRAESTTVVIERLVAEHFASVTLDFDGSVLSTGRHAEGTAVGFNKNKKGARSYYPLFCTVAQTDQVLDVHHRPGNVHDSNGADTFIEHCARTVRESLPRAKIEVRIDSAFFNQGIVERLHSLGVTFTVSVPFERFAELKEMVERRQRWRPMAGGLEYFESRWKPKSWNYSLSLPLHQKTRPTPEQVPHSTRSVSAHRVRIRVQGCRDQQENQSTQGRSLPRRTGLAGGHLCRAQDALPDGLRAGQDAGSGISCTCSPEFLLTTSLAELQMRFNPRERRTTAKRAALWCFREVETLRRTLIQRAGRIIRPAGKLILSMNSNARLEGELRHALAALNDWCLSHNKHPVIYASIGLSLPDYPRN